MPQVSLKPYCSMVDGRVKLYHGDAKQVLRRLPTESVYCVVTSPPYWKQRDYQVDGQIGDETNSQEYVERLADLFQEVRRVLRFDGTFWLNLGDKYVNGQLSGLPWRVALALQANGWILRQDIIWSKPDPMPEPVTNRCCTSHEHLFLLSKSANYYFDLTAIRLPHSEASKSRAARLNNARKRVEGVQANTRALNWVPEQVVLNQKGAAPRDVWSIPKEPIEGAHFAAFPSKLVETCLLAGCPERVCPECGAPETRRIEKESVTRDRPNDYVKRNGSAGTGNSCANSVAGVSIRTLGWDSGCSCGSEPLGGIVLDPFLGSGTTCAVALRLGRRSLGIELSEPYIRDIAIPRIEGEALGIPELAGLLRPSRAIAAGSSLGIP